jgi:hypothetical protein
MKILDLKMNIKDGTYISYQSIATSQQEGQGDMNKKKDSSRFT